jgi:hypothetical protein
LGPRYRVLPFIVEDRFTPSPLQRRVLHGAFWFSVESNRISLTWSHHGQAFPSREPGIKTIAGSWKIAVSVVGGDSQGAKAGHRLSAHTISDSGVT